MRVTQIFRFSFLKSTQTCQHEINSLLSLCFCGYVNSFKRPSVVIWCRVWINSQQVTDIIPCSVLIHTADWLKPWHLKAYLMLDVISMRYKEIGSSLITSQWRCRPLSLPLGYDPSTLRWYGDFGKNIGMAGVVKLRKRFTIWQILLEHGINSLHLVCFRGCWNLSTLNIAIPRSAFVRSWYNDVACG